MTEAIDVSIIIVSWKVKDLLRGCLNSIFQETKNISFEVFVVDNCSNDNTIEMVTNEFPQVKLIANNSNLGFAQANNQAIKCSRGDFILLLNPDTKLIDNSIEKVVNMMKQNPDIGISGCKLLNADQTIQPSVRRFPSVSAMSIIMLKLHYAFFFLPAIKNYLAHDFDYFKTQIADQVMGAFFMIRKRVIDDIGLLDENYYIWFEEVDYCYRARQRHWKTVYCAEAQIIHFSGQSFKQRLKYPKQKIFNNSLLRYIKKYHSPIEYWILKLISYPSLLIALILQLFTK